MKHPADISATPEDEALRWLVDLDDLSEVEQARFHAWLDERPENCAAFEKVERDWRQLDVVRQLATDTPDPEIVNKWLRRRRLRRYLPLAAAAGIAAAALAALLLPREDFEASYRTAIGEYEDVLLPDASVITLNTNSEVEVYFGARERQVRLLGGEAHFVVTEDPGRPFSVVAGSGTVRAVGTAFNVYLKGDVVEVTVTEGVVEVLPNAQPDAKDAEVSAPHTSPDDAVPQATVAVERLGKGQKLEYRETIRSVSNMDPGEIARKLAWQAGMLDFQGNTLAEVIEEASRYTTTRITIEDPEIKELHVTGYFRAGDIDTLLELIDSNDGVAVRRIKPDIVHIVASRD